MREGSHGILVNGTTGEPSSLTTVERNTLVRTAVEVAAHRVPVVAASGSQSYAETIELTAAAEKAGDLMLSAPGWAIHNHASNDEDVYELTIQDSPLNIWMGSLLWQENLSQPMEALGASGGFTTNRPAA